MSLGAWGPSWSFFVGTASVEKRGELTQSAAHGVIGAEQHLALVDVDHAESRRQSEKVFAFSRRRVGDMDEAAIFGVTCSGRTFNNVGRNRHRSPTKLGLQAKAFGTRHGSCRSIDVKDGRVSILKHPKLPVVSAHVPGLAQAACRAPNRRRKLGPLALSLRGRRSSNVHRR